MSEQEERLPDEEDANRRQNLRRDVSAEEEQAANAELEVIMQEPPIQPPNEPHRMGTDEGYVMFGEVSKSALALIQGATASSSTSRSTPMTISTSSSTPGQVFEEDSELEFGEFYEAHYSGAQAAAQDEALDAFANMERPSEESSTLENVFIPIVPNRDVHKTEVHQPQPLRPVITEEQEFQPILPILPSTEFYSILGLMPSVAISHEEEENLPGPSGQTSSSGKKS